MEMRWPKKGYWENKTRDDKIMCKVKVKETLLCESEMFWSMTRIRGGGAGGGGGNSWWITSFCLSGISGLLRWVVKIRWFYRSSWKPLCLSEQRVNCSVRNAACEKPSSIAGAYILLKWSFANKRKFQGNQKNLWVQTEFKEWLQSEMKKEIENILWNKLGFSLVLLNLCFKMFCNLLLNLQSSIFVLKL